MEQPDGSYPRINSELLRTGKYDDMIVSVVGRFDVASAQQQQHLNNNNADPALSSLPYTRMICSDDHPIELITEHAAALSPESLTVVNEMYFEVIGQAQQGNKLVVFVVRPLSTDMDVQVYNQMLMKVQHNPKFMKQYFPSSVGIN